MISVCLVDDQTLVRQGIRSLLELSDSIRVVAEAVDGAQAVQLIPEVAPDVRPRCPQCPRQQRQVAADDHPDHVR